jgi:hypothetical protein
MRPTTDPVGAFSDQGVPWLRELLNITWRMNSRPVSGRSSETQSRTKYKTRDHPNTRQSANTHRPSAHSVGREWASVIGHRENVTLGPGPNVTAEVTCYWPRSWDAHVMTSAIHAQHHNKSVTCSTDFEFMQQ